MSIRPKKKNCLFCVTVRKNRVGRSVKKFFFCIILCMFYDDWELGGQKKLKSLDFFE